LRWRIEWCGRFDVRARQRVKADSGRILLFLDEIQGCPEAVESLRYFHEKLPDIRQGIPIKEFITTNVVAWF